MVVQPFPGLRTVGQPTYGTTWFKKFTINETDDTLDRTLEVPPGTLLTDIWVAQEALWTAGTSASLQIGDEGDADGYYTAVDLKATDLLAGEALSFANQGGVGGAYLTVGTNTHVANNYYAAAETLTIDVTVVGTAGTAGVTHVWVFCATEFSGDVG